MKYDLPIEQQQKILSLLREQDDEGLRAVIEHYVPNTRKSLRRRFQPELDNHDIEEAIQEATLDVWLRPDQVELNKGSFAAWFLTTARHAAIDLFRKKQRWREQDQANYNRMLSLLTKSTEQSREQTRLISELRRAITELGELQRAIINADLEAGGFSVDASDLADRFETTRGTIYSSRCKAHKFLKARLREQGLFDN